MAEDDIAKQLSCSWNWAPDDPGSINTPGTNDYVFFRAMEANGQNLFVASGDYGAWPTTAYYYPEEDDYVTAVGGTVLTTGYPGGPWSSETSWVYSGGGVSPDDIPIPSYQKVSGVINSSNGGSTVYRNVPDVAMEAAFDNYNCALGDCNTDWGGTSFAAPRWAGYLALVNQVEEANHGTTLGFLNPLIYAIGLGSGYSAAFHDIDDYSTNDCCGQSVWYEAVPGYDLVTGWGSPVGCGLITALTGSCPLPTDSVSPTRMGLVSRNDQPATGTATLTNKGPAPLILTVYSIQVSGSYFSLTGGTCTTNTQLTSGGSCTAQVTFNPGGCVAPTSGQLTSSDNSTTGGQTVSLTGTTLVCTLVKSTG
jgi:subtilase family serine protease